MALLVLIDTNLMVLIDINDNYIKIVINININ